VSIPTTAAAPPLSRPHHAMLRVGVPNAGRRSELQTDHPHIDEKDGVKTVVETLTGITGAAKEKAYAERGWPISR